MSNAAFDRVDRPPPSQSAKTPSRKPPVLSEAEQELSEFAYIVSHDLAAALRHIAAFSHLLTRELSADASPDQRAYSAHIQDATNRCQLMMDQLLAYSRVQQAPLAPMRCDATRLMEIAVLQLSAEVQSADVEIAITPLGVAVMDQALMTLVFKHALSNAIKFRRPGAGAKVEVHKWDAPGGWGVRISDNGVGVAIERQEQMFRMFYQDHAEGASGGIGAGLAISRRILRRHGGDARFIEVERGACLQITLPTASACYAG